MNFVDLAVTRVIHALRDSLTPLRSCAEKLLQEERYHITTGRAGSAARRRRCRGGRVARRRARARRGGWFARRRAGRRAS
jgi:hypothetical protein